MPKGIPCLTEIQKQEIIKRVTDKGERAVDLAKEFKVDPKIIYNLLKTKANQHQANLDAKQNRKGDNRSPVEQAFEYRDKIDGIEWVITSNTNEIRLYSAGSGGRLKYQSCTFLRVL